MRGARQSFLPDYMVIVGTAEDCYTALVPAKEASLEQGVDKRALGVCYGCARVEHGTIWEAPYWLLPPDKRWELTRPRWMWRGRVRLIHGFAWLEVRAGGVFQPVHTGRHSSF